MRPLFLLIWISAVVHAAYASEKRYIEFDGTRYYLADEQANERESLREYVPTGQLVTAWDELVSVRTIKGLTDAKAYAANLQRIVLSSSPLAQCVVAQKKKVIIVDFLTWPEDMSYGEFNMMKVVSSKAGLTISQYARKWRGDDWGEKLKAERMRLYDVVYDASFEEETEPISEGSAAPERAAGTENGVSTENDTENGVRHRKQGLGDWGSPVRTVRWLRKLM
jgi:hypothetical protein